MKKKIADRLVRALRSGKYKQGEGHLNRHDSFCCLGVLCDLAEKSGIVKSDYDYNVTTYDNKSCTLPQSVQEWSGIHTELGIFDKSSTRSKFKSLAEMNDNNVPFKTIANFIERNYKKI